MSSVLRVNINKIIILFALALALLVVSIASSRIAFSQSPSPAQETPAPTGTAGSPATTFAFPIEDLEGCESEAACANYCEDPVHYNACADFAKENGFYRDDESQY